MVAEEEEEATMVAEEAAMGVEEAMEEVRFLSSFVSNVTCMCLLPYESFLVNESFLVACALHMDMFAYDISWA